MTLGDLVLVNAFLLQLFIPLNFLGVVYSQLKHSLADMHLMFEVLEREPEITDLPDAPALDAGHGEIRFEHVLVCLRPARADPAQRQSDRAAGAESGDCRPERRRQIDPCPPAVPFLRRHGRKHPDQRPGYPHGHPGQPARGPSASCRRTRCCSTTRCTTTSPMRIRTRSRRRYSRRHAWQTCTISSPPCRKATTR